MLNSANSLICQGNAILNSCLNCGLYIFYTKITVTTGDYFTVKVVFPKSSMLTLLTYSIFSP